MAAIVVAVLGLHRILLGQLLELLELRVHDRALGGFREVFPRADIGGANRRLACGQGESDERQRSDEDDTRHGTHSEKTRDSGRSQRWSRTT